MYDYTGCRALPLAPGLFSMFLFCNPPFDPVLRRGLLEPLNRGPFGGSWWRFLRQKLIDLKFFEFLGWTQNYQSINFWPVLGPKIYQSINFWPVLGPKIYQSINFWPVLGQKNYQSINFWTLSGPKIYQSINFWPVLGPNIFQSINVWRVLGPNIFQSIYKLLACLGPKVVQSKNLWTLWWTKKLSI